MATKKKATAVASKSKTGKSAAKKSAPAKKAGTKTSAAKNKITVKKAAPKKATAAKTIASPSKAKKATKKDAPKKAASKLNNKKAPTAQQKSAVKKTAKTDSKKAAPKKLEIKKPVVNTKKSTSKKEKISDKKTAPAKKSQDAKPIKQKSSEKASTVTPASNHKAELKKAIAKVKANKEEKKHKKEFIMPKTNTDKARKYEPEFTKSVLDQSAPENNGPTQRYSDNELQEFRELIARKLETAKKELGYLQGLITRKDQMGGDESDNRYMTMEDGSLSMEREQLSQMASRQITFIDHLEKAMMRIENKTYGICRVTGKLIDKARLRAVPHATLSIEAKMGTSK